MREIVTGLDTLREIAMAHHGFVFDGNARIRSAIRELSGASAMTFLQCLGEPVALASGQVTLPIAALQRLT